MSLRKPTADEEDRFNAISSFQLSCASALRKEFDEAERLTLEGIETMEKIGDKNGVARGMSILSTIAREKKDYSKAIKFLEESRLIYQGNGMIDEEARCIITIGEIQIKNNDFVAVKTSIQDAELLCGKSENKVLYSDLLHLMGNLEFSQGNLQNAKEIFQRELELVKEIDSPFGISSTIASLLLVLQELGENEEYHDLYQQFLDSKRKDKIADLQLEQRPNFNLWLQKKLNGEDEEAALYLDKFSELARQIEELGGESLNLKTL